MNKATSTTALTNDEYRSIKAWSNSDLSNINKGAAVVEWNKNTTRTEDSEAAIIGTATHSALLEPDLFAMDYVKMPDFDMRTNAGKLSAQGFIDGMAQSNKIVLKHDDYDLVISMRDSMLAHPIINKLLTSKGQSEVSIFFEVDGVKCKARPDRIVDPSVFDQHIVVDVKTSADVDKFARSVRDYRYHCQDAFYSDAYKKLTGFEPRFLFAVVGKGKVFGKHPARLFELDQDSIDEGRMQYLEDIEKVKEFEGFGMGQLETEVISLPKKWN